MRPTRFLEIAYSVRYDTCLLWPFSTRNGYGQVRIDGRLRYAHEVVCEQVHGPRPPGMEVAHGPCHARRCVNPTHLSWKTPAGNQADRERDGTVQSPLSACDIREIREQWATGEWMMKELAVEFGVRPETISRIINNHVRRSA